MDNQINLDVKPANLAELEKHNKFALIQSKPLPVRRSALFDVTNELPEPKKEEEPVPDKFTLALREVAAEQKAESDSRRNKFHQELAKEYAEKHFKPPIVKKRPPTKCIAIGNGKHVKVCSYRHKPYLNIRDYTTTSDGKLYATKRGILLHPEEWKQLKKVVKEVDQELKLV